jgi:type I restriction enzyme, S subunit
MSTTGRREVKDAIPTDTESELPEGWAECCVGYVLRIQNGYAFSSKDFQDDGIPLIRQANLAGNKVSLDKCVYLSESFLASKRDFVLRRGDLLIGMSGSIGKLCVYDADQPALQNQRTGKIVQHLCESIHPGYIYHFLSTAQDALIEKGKGLGVANVSASDIESLPFRIPPRLEQNRIASKIEEHFKHVNASRERLAKVPKILKAFRQSILAAACSGRLTADWRGEQEPEPAEKIVNLLKNTRENGEWWEPSFEIRPEEELPNGWQYAAFGNLGLWRGGGTPSKSNQSFWTAGTIPWISPKDMKVPVLYDAQDHITEEAVNHTRLPLLPAGAILFVVRGLILARSFPVALSGSKLTVNQDIRAVVPAEGVRDRYLFHALQAEAMRILFAVKEATHGTLRLESETLKRWPIPLPSREEQDEIVRRVEALFKLADAIEKRVAAAQTRVDKLTQSILAKAFRGELVPPEAELARQEGREYEPASVLLERIRAERRQQDTVKHKHQRTGGRTEKTTGVG